MFSSAHNSYNREYRLKSIRKCYRQKYEKINSVTFNSKGTSSNLFKFFNIQRKFSYAESAVDKKAVQMQIFDI